MTPDQQWICSFIIASSIVLVPGFLICVYMVFRKLNKQMSVSKRLLIAVGIVLGLCFVYLLLNSITGTLLNSVSRI